MKRRLRKKKHLGEFRQFGFYLYLYIREEIEEQIAEDFKHSLLNDLEKFLDVPPVGAFWGKEYLELFICPVSGSATEKEREWLRNRLSSDVNVVSFEMGDCLDAWYDPSFRYPGIEPHPFGPWSEVICPGKIWWKRGQPVGLMALSRWTVQQMLLRVMEQNEESDDQQID
ncbi:MAG: DUF469 family protein [Candidatus Latescibacteria bacterium]|nr:DUF469 family protein [bacterium]MBD3424962.1 DUF469 family protein [Candidatus Latescibacterota bacterium]